MKRSRSALPVLGNPVACHLTTDPDEAGSIRRIDCRSYDRCLDLAVESGWRGFHCKECRGYEAPTPEEQRRDYMGALTLLAETQLLASLAIDDVIVDECDEDDDQGDDAEAFEDERAGRRGFAPSPVRTDETN
jgi:hypothetical protein